MPFFLPNGVLHMVTHGAFIGRDTAKQLIAKLVEIEVRLTKKQNGPGRGPSKAEFKEERKAVEELFALMVGDLPSDAEYYDMVP